jgi:hypothetical protein
LVFERGGELGTPALAGAHAGQAGQVRDEGAAGCWTKLCPGLLASNTERKGCSSCQSHVHRGTVGCPRREHENYLEWFTAVDVQPDVPQLQARHEGRLDWRAKCHLIWHTVPPSECEWVLLEWADCPTSKPPRRAGGGLGLAHPRSKGATEIGYMRQ